MQSAPPGPGLACPHCVVPSESVLPTLTCVTPPPEPSVHPLLLTTCTSSLPLGVPTPRRCPLTALSSMRTDASRLCPRSPPQARHTMSQRVTRVCFLLPLPRITVVPGARPPPPSLPSAPHAPCRLRGLASTWRRVPGTFLGAARAPGSLLGLPCCHSATPRTQAQWGASSALFTAVSPEAQAGVCTRQGARALPSPSQMTLKTWLHGPGRPQEACTPIVSGQPSGGTRKHFPLGSQRAPCLPASGSAPKPQSRAAAGTGHHTRDPGWRPRRGPAVDAGQAPPRL